MMTIDEPRRWIRNVEPRIVAEDDKEEERKRENHRLYGCCPSVEFHVCSFAARRPIGGWCFAVNSKAVSVSACCFDSKLR